LGPSAEDDRPQVFEAAFVEATRDSSCLSSVRGARVTDDLRGPLFGEILASDSVSAALRQDFAPAITSKPGAARDLATVEAP
jgi:hypothetical protein